MRPAPTEGKAGLDRCAAREAARGEDDGPTPRAQLLRTIADSAGRGPDRWPKVSSTEQRFPADDHAPALIVHFGHWPVAAVTAGIREVGD